MFRLYRILALTDIISYTTIQVRMGACVQVILCQDRIGLKYTKCRKARLDFFLRKSFVNCGLSLVNWLCSLELKPKWRLPRAIVTVSKFCLISVFVHDHEVTQPGQLQSRVRVGPLILRNQHGRKNPGNKTDSSKNVPNLSPLRPSNPGRGYNVHTDD